MACSHPLKKGKKYERARTTTYTYGHINSYHVCNFEKAVVPDPNP
jgi:hypothetical protein